MPLPVPCPESFLSPCSHQNRNPFYKCQYSGGTYRIASLSGFLGKSQRASVWQTNDLTQISAHKPTNVVSQAWVWAFNFQTQTPCRVQDIMDYDTGHSSQFIQKSGTRQNVKKSSYLQIRLGYFIHSRAPMGRGFLRLINVIAMTTSSANSCVFSADWQWLWGKSLVEEIWRQEIGLSRKRLRLQAGSNKGV